MGIPIGTVIAALDDDNNWRRYQVDYPEASSGNFRIQKYVIQTHDPKRIKIIVNEGLMRDTGSGVFRRLVEVFPGAGDQGQDMYRTWMSDTRAEIIEHAPILEKLDYATGPGIRVLINGLGLGLVAKAALSYANVTNVDVVENNVDVIELVGQFLTADSRVTIHLGDAYNIGWPAGTRWDLAWHDIWPEISDDNLPGMDDLMARYRSRVRWQGCWQRDGCLKMARYFRQMKAGTLSVEKAYELIQGKGWL